ncbi:MAG: sigma-70 family RNA polymerase sigma factor [Planctomycetes bacterium]|nr:sigma-70 family RNA polymerase sigma factor [Planctomycetota bacterium]
MADSAPPYDSLVPRARQDARALGQLYDRHYPGVLRYCVCRLFSRDAAEEVTSEVFLAVARQIRDFDGRTEEQFVCWLYGIATRQVNAHIRSATRRKALLADAVRVRQAAARPDDDPPEPMDWPTLYAALASLKPREQALVTLRCFEQWPFERIAAALTLRPVAARVAYGRALERLRSRLGEAFGRA